MANQSLSQTETPEETEARLKMLEIERLQDELAAVQEEMETHKLRLQRFESEYTQMVAPYYMRLDRWRLRCEEVRWMIDALRQVTTTGGKVANFDQFRAQRERQFRAKWATQREAERERDEWPRPVTDPELPMAGQAELRELYRQLAKRFHPDLATAPSVKVARELKMKEINSAYQTKDIGRLQIIRNEPDLSETFDETIGERLVRLIRAQSRVKRLLAESKAALEKLRNSDLGQLFMQCEAEDAQGRDGLAAIVAQVGQQAEEARTEWEQLRANETDLWKMAD